MIRTLSKVVAAGFAVVAMTFGVLGTQVSGQTPMVRSALHDFHVVPVAEGLVTPWSVAFLPARQHRSSASNRSIRISVAGSTTQ